METNLDEEQHLSVNKKTTLYNIDTNVCLACQLTINQQIIICALHAINQYVRPADVHKFLILKKNLKNLHFLSKYHI